MRKRNSRQGFALRSLFRVVRLRLSIEMIAVLVAPLYQLLAATGDTTARHTSSVRVPVGVLVREGVSGYTMSFSRILRRNSITPHHVRPLRDRLKMLGVAAERLSAEVVQNQSLGNGANRRFVSENVRVPATLAVLYTAVLTTFPPFCRALPNPAAIGINKNLGSDTNQRPGGARRVQLATCFHRENLRWADRYMQVRIA